MRRNARTHIQRLKDISLACLVGFLAAYLIGLVLATTGAIQ